MRLVAEKSTQSLDNMTNPDNGLRNGYQEGSDTISRSFASRQTTSEVPPWNGQ